MDPHDIRKLTVPTINLGNQYLSAISNLVESDHGCVFLKLQRGFPGDGVEQEPSIAKTAIQSVNVTFVILKGIILSSCVLC